jgi:dienelactone hydrolase
VDASRIGLAGWSHGGWAIMDLMTMRLERPGEAKVADATPRTLDGLKSLFLVYPYVGFGSRSRHRDWVRAVPTFGLIAPKDHIGPPAQHEAAYVRARAGGCEVETWTPEGATHAFDQPTQAFAAISPMRLDPALAKEAQARFAAHLQRTLV